MKRKCKPECRRFRQVGRLEIAAFEITIEVSGKRVRTAQSTTTVWLKCLDCGHLQQQDEKKVVNE